MKIKICWASAVSYQAGYSSGNLAKLQKSGDLYGRAAANEIWARDSYIVYECIRIEDVRKVVCVERRMNATKGMHARRVN